MNRPALARTATAVLALALLAGTAALTDDPPPVPAAATGVAVEGATAVCPDTGDGVATTTAALPVGSTARLVAGRLGAAPAPLEGTRVPDLGAGEPGPLVVTATGAGAGLLAVEQRTRATSGPARAAAVLACPAPTVDAWFVGGATTVGRSGEVLLVNADDVPAVVDVTTWTEDGPADARPGRGVPVPPRSRVVLPLDRLAPDRELLGLHVRAVRGRVAPAVRVRAADGRTPLGGDWLPLTAPSREALVPGLLAGPAPRRVLLTNPSDVAAVVALDLLTADGVQPLPPVEVPAGAARSTEIALAAGGSALRVVSDGPAVVAGVQLEEGRVARETAYSAAVPPLDALALVADARLSVRAGTSLVLTAVEEDASVELLPRDGAPRRVDVPAGTTVVVDLAELLEEGSLTLEVRPLAGRLVAARVDREPGSPAPLVSTVPLRSGRATASAPAVVSGTS